MKNKKVFCWDELLWSTDSHRGKSREDGGYWEAGIPFPQIQQEKGKTKYIKIESNDNDTSYTVKHLLTFIAYFQFQQINALVLEYGLF